MYTALTNVFNDRNVTDSLGGQHEQSVFRHHEHAVFHPQVLARHNTGSQRAKQGARWISIHLRTDDLTEIDVLCTFFVGQFHHGAVGPVAVGKYFKLQKRVQDIWKSQLIHYETSTNNKKYTYHGVKLNRCGMRWDDMSIRGNFSFG